MRIAVIGHVEHITLGRVPAVPRAGEIAHLGGAFAFPGGGGGVAFFQLLKSDAELDLFSAIGNDEAGRFVRARLEETQASLHLAAREEPHTRDVVMVTPEGERTIVVVGEPLHPTAADPLPFQILAGADAAYFTAQDPALLRLARKARLLIATARRRETILRAGVRCDLIVGSTADPREASAIADWPVPPAALVMTEGAAGGRIEHADGRIERFSSEPLIGVRGGAYGAGDSFAAALTYYLAGGLPVLEAATRAARHGRAVLGGLNPLEQQVPLRLGG